MQPIKVEDQNSGAGQLSRQSDDWRVLGPAQMQFSDGGRRRRAHRRSPRYTVADFIGIVILALLLGCVSLFVYAPRSVSPFIAEVQKTFKQVSGWAGLNVQQISLSGYRYTSDIDIFEVLNAYSGQSLIGLDVKAASDGLKKLPWIANVDIARNFPDELVVDIIERKPYAIWQVDSKFWIINEAGEKLAEVGSESFADLISISGVGANKRIAGFVETLRGFPGIWRQVSLVERVGARRWNLHLGNGTVVRLPARNERKALSTFKQVQKAVQIEGAFAKVIDLRLGDRVVVGKGRSKEPVVHSVQSLSSGTLTKDDLSIPAPVHKSKLSKKNNGGTDVKY